MDTPEKIVIVTPLPLTKKIKPSENYIDVNFIEVEDKPSVDLHA